MTADASGIPPDFCAIAFKEWAGVCSALESGGQSLILRKGGIAEGPRGFVPEHRAFWLYPTYLHQAQQGLKQGVTAPEPVDPETFSPRALAIVEHLALIEDLDRLEALDGLHVWTLETLIQRFQYRRPGLWLLGVRVYRTELPAPIAVTPEHEGCKTWVPIEPAISTEGLSPVVGEAEFRQAMRTIETILQEVPGR